LKFMIDTNKHKYLYFMVAQVHGFETSII
jgi:hypothetical protein